MSSQLESSIDKMKIQQNELMEEIQNQHQEFLSILDKSTIYFEESTLARPTQETS
jgi:hypothetical protein